MLISLNYSITQDQSLNFFFNGYNNLLIILIKLVPLYFILLLGILGKNLI